MRVHNVSSQQIKALRKRLDWTQEQAGEASRVKGETIYRMEAGRRAPNQTVAQCLYLWAMVKEIPVHDLGIEVDAVE